MKSTVFENTISVYKKSFGLFVIFSIWTLFVATIHYLSQKLIPSIFAGILFSILDLLLFTYFYSGFYGLTFVKTHQKIAKLNSFFYIASENYLSFLMIRLFKYLSTSLFVFLLLSIASAVMPKAFYVTSSSYFSTIFTFLINLMFLFALPISIVGYFAEKKLSPIRTSFLIISTRLNKVLLLIALMILKIILGRIVTHLFEDELKNIYIIGYHLIYAPIDFFILIFSYEFIKEFFTKELVYNFEDKI